MHSVADFPADDWCAKYFCFSDAGAEEVEHSVHHVSSSMRAAGSVKKQPTFPVRLVQAKGTEKQFAVTKRSAQTKKAKTKSYGVYSSEKRTKSRKLMCSAINRKTQALFSTLRLRETLLKRNTVLQ